MSVTKRMRCKACMFLNWDFITDKNIPVEKGKEFCGLHGGTRVDINGLQVNLNNRGSCGYISKMTQLNLFEDI